MGEIDKNKKQERQDDERLERHRIRSKKGETERELETLEV